MNLTQLQREGPRLVAMHGHLIRRGASMWCMAKAARRFKESHAPTLEADQRYVAELCLTHTCAEMGVFRMAILGERRRRKVVNARHIAMTVAYELSGLSSLVLGVKFRRGHDMILWAQKRVNGDRALRAQADKVSRAVKRELRKK